MPGELVRELSLGYKPAGLYVSKDRAKLGYAWKPAVLQRNGSYHCPDCYQVILDRDDILAVSIATPDFAHTEIAVAAAKAGKHILIEKPLAISPEQLKQIVDLLLSHVAERVEGQGMKLVISEEVKVLLAREGFDRMLGARPLRRAIQRLIEDTLSDELLFGKFHEGDTIEAVISEGGVTFRRSEELASLAH